MNDLFLAALAAFLAGVFIGGALGLCGAEKADAGEAGQRDTAFVRGYRCVCHLVGVHQLCHCHLFHRTSQTALHHGGAVQACHYRHPVRALRQGAGEHL